MTILIFYIHHEYYLKKRIFSDVLVLFLYESGSFTLICSDQICYCQFWTCGFVTIVCPHLKVVCRGVIPHNYMHCSLGTSQHSYTKYCLIMLRKEGLLWHERCGISLYDEPSSMFHRMWRACFIHHNLLSKRLYSILFIFIDLSMYLNGDSVETLGPLSEKEQGKRRICCIFNTIISPPMAITSLRSIRSA